MTSAPAPASPAILAEVPISVPSRPRTGNRPAFVAAWIALLLLCAGKIAMAQTAHFSGSETQIGSGFSEPLNLAVDAEGDLFVSDAENIAIYEVLAVNGSIPAAPTIRTLYRPTANPDAIAVDGNGNVYFTTADVYSNLGNNTVTELIAVNGVIPASPTVRQLGSGLSYPSGVAVDRSGDVFVSDSNHSLVKEFLAINGSVPASPTILTLGSGFSDPRGIAVDAAGNVYVVDFGNKAAKEILAVGGSIPASPTINTLDSNFCGPWGLALDSTGDLFVADYCNASVFELLAVGGSMPASPAVLLAANHIPGIEGVAVSPQGTIYAGNVNNTIPAIVPSITSFGALNMGTESWTSPLTVTFDSAGTLSSIAVLTAGAVGQDFVNTGTGTCVAGMLYATGSTCSVDVSFTPKAAGARTGAAVLYGSSGNAVATGYLHGTGTGPQVAFAPASQSALGSGYLNPMGTAVDGNGNVYVADETHGQIKELLAVGGKIPSAPAINILGSAFSYPHGVAVDAAGNVYVADEGNSAVKEILAVNGSIPAAPTILTLASGLSNPWAIAVDGNENVFFTEPYNDTVEEILAVNGSIPASPVIKPIGSGFNYPFGVAVDSSGNLYVGDSYNNAVKEILAVNGSIPASPTIKTLSSSFYYPGNMAVDGIGNVYVSDFGNNTVKEILAVNGSIPGSPTIVTLASGLNFPFGVAVDSGFNLYVGDTENNRILELDFADPPSLTFTSTAIGSTSTDSPQMVTVENVGNAALNFPIPTSGNNPSIAANFALDDNGASACPELNALSSAWGTLAAGASCQLSISFIPQAAGSLSGSVVLTDNNLNAVGLAYATQTISLSGTGIQAMPQITWAQPAAITYGAALDATQLNATSTVPGSFTYSPAAGAVLAAGTQTLTVTFTPTDTADYSTATATVSLTVNQAAPSVTWGAPSAITYGTALGGTQLNATSTVTGSFTYSPAAGTVLTAGTQILSVTFTPADTTDYTGATATTQLTVNKATPAITWPAPAAITYGTPLSSAQLDATSTIAGLFTYSPAAGAVLTPGTQTLSVTFTPADTTDYTGASAATQLAVNKATPAITWPGPAPIAYGMALSATQLDAASTVAGTFTYSPAAGTVLAPGMQTLSVTFTPTDLADYVPATQAVMLTVNKATPAVTWATPAAINYGKALSSRQLNATSTIAGKFTYSPAAGTVLTAGTQILTTTFTPTNTTDYTVATATVSLVVNQVTPVITWPKPAAITQGTALSSTQLDATSTVAGTFTYSPAAGTVLSAGSQTLTAVFTPTDSTDYNTATRSVVLTVNPAPSLTLSASTSSLSVAQGASGRSTITLNPKNGFSGSAMLIATGLPNGVTASFSTNPIADTSVVTFTAASTATVGSATVTITGTSGSLTASKTIVLTVKQLR